MTTEIFITAVVALLGYLYNSSQNRQFKKFELKTGAYAEYLRRFELLIPAEEGRQNKNNDDIKKLNEALSILLIYAPANIVREMNQIANNNGKLNREVIKKVQCILHKDIHNNHFSRHFFSVKSEDFPHFPFQ